MTRYAVFIRNIMVGRNGLDRDILVDAFREHGATRVDSVLATGNLVFDAKPSQVEGIVYGARHALQTKVGLAEPMFLREFRELKELAPFLPFASPRFATVHERCVTFLSSGSQLRGRLPYHSPREDFEVVVAYELNVFSATWLVANRPGQPGKWIERQTGSAVTTRNWNTIERLLKR